MTHPRHAPADRSGDLTGAQLIVFGQHLNDREGHRVSEQATETRLPVAWFFHATGLTRFGSFENSHAVRFLIG